MGAHKLQDGTENDVWLQLLIKFAIVLRYMINYGFGWI